jgi:hypothetical protein
MANEKEQCQVEEVETIDMSAEETEQEIEAADMHNLETISTILQHESPADRIRLLQLMLKQERLNVEKEHSDDTAEVERKLAEANQQLFVLKNFGQYAAGNGCGCTPCGNACGTC